MIWYLLKTQTSLLLLLLLLVPVPRVGTIPKFLLGPDERLSWYWCSCPHQVWTGLKLFGMSNVRGYKEKIFSTPVGSLWIQPPLTAPTASPRSNETNLRKTRKILQRKGCDFYRSMLVCPQTFYFFSEDLTSARPKRARVWARSARRAQSLPTPHPLALAVMSHGLLFSFARSTVFWENRTSVDRLVQCPILYQYPVSDLLTFCWLN